MEKQPNQDKNHKKFKRIRASFKFLNPFSLSRNTSTKQAYDSALYVKEQSSDLIKHIHFLYSSSKKDLECPKCKKQTLKIIKDAVSLHPPTEKIIHDQTNQIESYNSKNKHLLLKCEDCGYTHSMTDIISDDKTLIISQNLYKNAKVIFWTTFIILITGTLYSLYSNSLISLIGFITVSFVSFLKCAQLRYKGWQYAYKRLFETEAPIQDWIRWEKNRIQS